MGICDLLVHVDTKEGVDIVLPPAIALSERGSMAMVPVGTTRMWVMTSSAALVAASSTALVSAQTSGGGASDSGAAPCGDPIAGSGYAGFRVVSPANRTPNCAAPCPSSMPR